MLATEYAKYYNIAPQGDNEDDLSFRRRVARDLREAGHIIEAHEAQHNERYKDSDNVMTGLIGAVAQALHGTNYSGDPVGNDIAAGTLIRHQMSPEGQAEERQKELIVNLLMAGMSPDDVGKLNGG